MNRYASFCSACNARIDDAAERCPQHVAAGIYMRLGDSAYRELLADANAAFDALTPEEQAAHRREQAISFAYGNVKCDGHGGDLTMEDFARIYDEMKAKDES